MRTIRYADIKTHDINNGQGTRISLWVTGCPIKCRGCHNEAISEPTTGDEYTLDTQDYILSLLADEEFNKDLSILGGEPLAVWNYEEVLKLCKKVKELMPHKNICIWTGYVYENIQHLEIMKYIDTLIDGQYIDIFNDEETWWRGSKNQRMFKFKNGIGYEVNSFDEAI